MNFYNEWEPYAAQWIRNLGAAGHIGTGTVDERSIADIRAEELAAFTQCHFFAGIAGWPEALRLAGWPADRPVWTGSCPCQDYSVAGKQEGSAGKRDLWPDFFSLIRECHPDTIFGEQVANAIGFGWLDRICADLEGEGYAVGAVVLGAHSVGAPHIRQRLYWVADAGKQQRQQITGSALGHEEPNGRQSNGDNEPASDGEDFRVAQSGLEHEGWRLSGSRESASASRSRASDEPGGSGGLERLDDPTESRRARSAESGSTVEAWNEARLQEPKRRSGTLWMGEPIQPGLERFSGNGDRGGESGWLSTDTARSIAAAGADGGVADANGGQSSDRDVQRSGKHGLFTEDGEPGFWLGHADGQREDPEQGISEGARVERERSTFWSDAIYIPCADGKARPAQPGIQPLAHGVQARVGKLRAAGNAIVPQVAAEFIRAFLEASL